MQHFACLRISSGGFQPALSLSIPSAALPAATLGVHLRRGAHAAVALACLALGLVWALRHPMAPLPVAACVVGWVLVCLRWPDLWLFAIPAALPALSLAPWTGWVALDELDLALLATLAAGHLRLAWIARQPDFAVPPADAAHWRRIDLLCLALWASLLLGLALGWADSQFPPAGPPEEALRFANSLRVAKSLAFALLFVPLLRAALQRSPAQAQRLLVQGVVVSLVVVAIGVLWERKAFPGLLDFSSGYRTVGLFWEMHKGGATIDAFLALAMPFSVWALATARRPLRWLAAALLAQIMAYVCLTTFARGVYGAVLGGLVVVALLAWRQRVDAAKAGDATDPPPPWRPRATQALLTVLVLQVAMMVAASGFLAQRLDDADDDFGHRWNHWTRGIGLLQTQAEWWRGLGLGRLPAHYVAAPGPAVSDLADAENEELPGAVEWLQDSQGGAPPRPFARLWAPPARIELGGRYMLTQQIRPVPGQHYRLSLDLRTAQAVGPVLLAVRVCERHLLYRADCQIRNVLHSGRVSSAWRHVEVDLRGPLLRGGRVWAPRMVSLSLAAVIPGSVVDVTRVRLTAGSSPDLLANGGFEQGLARWYPIVRSYFLPWHIDNLYIELLIERGIIGLLLFGALVGTALWRVSFGAARLAPAAPYLAAALASGCALGLVSSILDMPRPAFLLLLLALWCLHLPRAGPRRDDPVGL